MTSSNKQTSHVTDPTEISSSVRTVHGAAASDERVRPCDELAGAVRDRATQQVDAVEYARVDVSLLVVQCFGMSKAIQGWKERTIYEHT